MAAAVNKTEAANKAAVPKASAPLTETAATVASSKADVKAFNGSVKATAPAPKSAAAKTQQPSASTSTSHADTSAQPTPVPMPPNEAQPNNPIKGPGDLPDSGRRTFASKPVGDQRAKDVAQYAVDLYDKADGTLSPGSAPSYTDQGLAIKDKADATVDGLAVNQSGLGKLFPFTTSTVKGPPPDVGLKGRLDSLAPENDTRGEYDYHLATDNSVNSNGATDNVVSRANDRSLYQFFDVSNKYKKSAASQLEGIREGNSSVMKLNRDQTRQWAQGKVDEVEARFAPSFTTNSARQDFNTQVGQQGLEAFMAEYAPKQ